MLVGERDGRAVEFQFADVVRGPGFALDAADELVQFVQRFFCRGDVKNPESLTTFGVSALGYNLFYLDIKIN